jgi:hypothetical protein
MAVPEELSVGKIFEHDDYIIPLYQRNYAWEQAQVTQLIRDIWDYKKEDANYYIGTLVVYSRDTDNKVVYETIDGQQRLTTLNILLSVLKNEFKLGVSYRHESKLKFDSRIVSSDTLKVLADQGKADNKVHSNTRMLQAYLDMAKELRQLTSSKKLEVEMFAEYLLNRVKILRVEVPRDTDLNHYFEIMNNRGEQLEKHEILKAEFLSHLRLHLASSKTFSMIWDACSDMERYMVLGFRKELRDSLFEADDLTWDYFPANFEEIRDKVKAHTKPSSNSKVEKSLLDIIDSEVIHLKDDEELIKENIRFNPVINFSNFLLHVLRVTSQEDIPLDDKKLIQTFKRMINSKEDKAQFSLDFAYNLLRMRYMFDRYIIKREFTQNEDKWSLQGIKISVNGKHRTFYYKNTFSEAKNKQILMLLSMFHVSFPQIIYKHWLSGVLNYLHGESTEIDADDYITYLEKLSDAFYYDRFGEKEVDYYDIIFKNNAERTNLLIDDRFLHCGTDVQNFIFNRLDYLIWKSEVVSQENRFKVDNIQQFEFSFRSSVEHYYPQNPKPGAVSKDLPKEVLDSFGNLCLISRNKNSELSNYSPLAKAEHYAKSSTIESLKQQLMMRHKSNWDEIAIDKHGEEMIHLLES